MRKLLAMTMSIALFLCFSACGTGTGDVSGSESAVPPGVDGAGCTHSFGKWSVQQEATCQQEGVQSRTCTLCQFVENQTIEKKDHVVVVDSGKVATCIEAGLTEGKHCSVCGTVVVAREPVLAAGHIYENDKDDTCNTCGFKRVLNCKHARQINIKGQAATCTAGGITDGKVCKDCEQILQKQTAVAAKGHVEKVDKKVAPTCTKSGLTAGKHCSVCQVILQAQKVVAATGHRWSAWSTTKEPTATAQGAARRQCGSCSAIETKSLPKKESYIRLSKTHITVEEGTKSEKIGLEISTNEEGEYPIDLTPSNDNVTFSWNGSLRSGFYVHGNKVGTTVITVTDRDLPGASATLTVTVTPKVRPQGIALDQTYIDGKIGKAYELKANITPANAQDKTVKWTSSNDKVATVSPMVGQSTFVSAVGEGTAIITATTVDGGFMATCTITVSAIPVQGIEITTSIKMNYYKGETLQLKYRITPYDATNQKVTWTSSNSEIATVDRNGLVTFVKGIAAKNVRITVTTADGAYTDYVTLYCVPDPAD